MELLKKKFALTDKGASGLLKASISTFFMYVSYMFPMMIVLYFVQSIIEGKNIESIKFYIGLICIVACIMYIFINKSYKLTYNEAYKESANLRIEIAKTLKDLPMSYFSKHNISDLSQTIMSDVSDLEHALSHAVPECIGMLFFLFIISIMLIIGDYRLGLCIVIPFVISIILLIITKRNQVKSLKKYYDRLRGNSEIFQESIELQQEIKSFNRKEDFSKKIINAIDDSEKVHIKAEISQAAPTNLAITSIKLALGFTIIVGVNLYIKNMTSLLFLIAYVISATRLIDSVSLVLMNIEEIFYVDARIKKINEIKAVEIQEGEDVDLSSYDIEINNIEFSYKDEIKVINGLSLLAKQNEVTAFVGPSGCGKTTILRLISRLYDYDKGSILIGGKEIKNISTDSLYENISIVFQDVMLFNDSVMENIRVGKKEATDEEVIKAAKLANCHEFIEKLPNGYDTLIGENGGKLSGGERQRISIARAFLKDAPIILLDEISASLDVENEMKIQESLNSLIKNKTVVIISHRLKSIENANKIVVMNKGKIDSIGTHNELLDKSKLYKKMVEKSRMTEKYIY